VAADDGFKVAAELVVERGVRAALVCILGQSGHPNAVERPVREPCALNRVACPLLGADIGLDLSARAVVR
jgi:hypothetical protein